MRKAYEWFGGRKQFNGYLFAVLVIVLGLHLDASFVAVAGFLAAGLGITSGAVALEDGLRGDREYQ